MAEQSNLDKLPKTEYCYVTFDNPSGGKYHDKGTKTTIKMKWSKASIMDAKKAKGSKRIISVVPIEDKK